MSAKYRRGDERGMLVIPVLRQKLRVLNPGVITDDGRANIIIPSDRDG